MNFCFVVDNLLSASSQPGKNRRIKYYMDLYKENNIKVLVSLHRKIEVPEEYSGKFEIYHFKWSDIENSDVKNLDHIVNIVLSHVNKKEAVNINCEGGTANSAAMLAATIMKYKGISKENALEIISKHRYAMGDDESTQLLETYEYFLSQQNSEDSETE